MNVGKPILWNRQSTTVNIYLTILCIHELCDVCPLNFPFEWCCDGRALRMLLQIINQWVNIQPGIQVPQIKGVINIANGFYAVFSVPWKTINQFIRQLFNEYLTFATPIGKQIDLNKTCFGRLCIYLSIILLEHYYTAYEHKFCRKFWYRVNWKQIEMLIDHERAILRCV